VKWNDCFSHTFSINSGVRQGGVLSRLLFNCYTNLLITNLKKSDLGCKLNNCYVGCILYADDIMLLSGSILNLQKMLNICYDVSLVLGISFNGLKSHCIHIGHSVNKYKIDDMLIGNIAIDWACKLKYLGIWIKSGKNFEIDITESRNKFFRTANCILNKSKFACDMVKLSLLESHCLPIILYFSDSCFNDNI